MPDAGDAHVRDLRSFLVVADQLSFTRAAELLYVSQPALSKHFKPALLARIKRALVQYVEHRRLARIGDATGRRADEWASRALD